MRTTRNVFASHIPAMSVFVGLVFPTWHGNAQIAPRVDAVQTVGFTVRDMDRSLVFFTDVLEFEVVSDTEVTGDAYEHLQGVFPVLMRVVRLKLGEEFLELTDYLAPEGRSFPEDLRSNDRAFQHAAIVVSDMRRAYARLREHKVTHVSAKPQRLPDWNINAGGIEAFYFKDIDGHVLEIISYPRGKGDPRWQQSNGRLFLGIDHTAIVVSNTDSSLIFYRDVLGFRVAGESENYGPEQERLNAVFGARLRITGLKTDAGPGVEFLEYLNPRDGRAMPLDVRANDLLHWQTTLVTSDVRRLAALLETGRFQLISPAVVQMPNADLGFQEGFLVRDPDGHVMRIVDRSPVTMPLGHRN